MVLYSSMHDCPLRRLDLGLYCRSVRALHSTGTDNIEQAVSWIVEHEEDADLDTPLLIPQVLWLTNSAQWLFL